MAVKKPIVDYSGKQGEILASDTIPIGNLGTGTPTGLKFLRDDGTFAVPNSGIVRSVLTISTNTTLPAVINTDYVVFVSGAITVTLPTAVGNTNNYTFIKTDSGTKTGCDLSPVRPGSHDYFHC